MWFIVESCSWSDLSQFFFVALSVNSAGFVLSPSALWSLQRHLFFVTIQAEFRNRESLRFCGEFMKKHIRVYVRSVEKAGDDLESVLD